MRRRRKKLKSLIAKRQYANKFPIRPTKEGVKNSAKGEIIPEGPGENKHWIEVEVGTNAT